MAFDALVEADVPTLTLSGVLPNYGPDIVTWPWPRLILTPYHVFSVTRHADTLLYLSTLTLENGTLAPTVLGPLGSAATVDSVEIADFGLFFVVSTLGLSTDAVPVSTIRTYLRDPATSVYPFLTAFSTPTIGVVCNYHGQLVGGNIVNNTGGLWSDLGTDGVVWSGIGSFELDPSIDFTAGFLKGLFPQNFGGTPTIYKLLPLDSRYEPSIIVYSNAGRFALVPNQTQTGFTYGIKDMGGLGITSGNHVAGGRFVHGFIDVHRDFWLLESPHYASPIEGNYKKLGYRSYIKELFDYTSTEDHRVIVNYVDKNKRFYISNGNKCLIINEFGACHCFQAVSSVIKASDGRLYGTFKSNPDTTALLVSDELDFGSRGLKTVESIVGGIDAPRGATVQYAVDWRQTRSNPFARLPWRSVNPRGEARMGVTAAEHRLAVKISNYVDAQIEWLAVNVKFPDNRFKRGPSLADANIVSTRNEA